MLFIGEIAALAAALFWSVNSIVLTEATHLVGTFAVNLGRLVFASLLLFITLLILGVDVNLTLHQIFLLISSGAIGLIVGDTAMLKAYKTIGPRLTMLLMALTPPMAALMAFLFLGEKLTLLQTAGIFVTILGIVVVIVQKKGKGEIFHFTFKGTIAGIIAAFGQAAGLILVKQAFELGEINEFLAAFIRISSAVLLLLIFGRFLSKTPNPLRLFSNNKRALKYTFYGSILGPYLGITASLVALNYTLVGIASTLMSTVPVLMLPISKYYYKEELTWQSISGAIIAVVGVSMIFLS